MSRDNAPADENGLIAGATADISTCVHIRSSVCVHNCGMPVCLYKEKENDNDRPRLKDKESMPRRTASYPVTIDYDTALRLKEKREREKRFQRFFFIDFNSLVRNTETVILI